MKNKIFILLIISLLLPISIVFANNIMVIGIGQTRDDALHDAYRLGAEKLNGIHIQSDTLIVDNQQIYDKINAKSYGRIIDYRIIKEEYIDNQIRLTVDLNISPYNNDQVTGLVIYAGNFDLVMSQNPKIYNQNGNVIYGEIINDDMLLKVDLVQYAFDPNSQLRNVLGQTRAGISPITVTVIALADNNESVVISNEDAQKVLKANENYHFLEYHNVLFTKSVIGRKVPQKIKGVV